MRINKINERKSSVMAGEYEHIKGKGNRFSSTNQPANRGRKKSAYKQLLERLKESGHPLISKEEYDKISSGVICQPTPILVEIEKDEDTPAFVRTDIRGLLSDMKIGSTKTLDKILDRILGKPTQPTENKHDVSVKGSIPISKWIENNIEK